MLSSTFGWEWEMGLYDLMVDAAKAKGVKLLLLQIPREVMEQQAADKGDVRFSSNWPTWKRWSSVGRSSRRR